MLSARKVPAAASTDTTNADRRTDPLRLNATLLATSTPAESIVPSASTLTLRPRLADGPFRKVVLEVVRTGCPATSKSVTDAKRVTRPSISALLPLWPPNPSSLCTRDACRTLPARKLVPFTSTMSPTAGPPAPMRSSVAVE